MEVVPQPKENEAQLHFLDYWRIIRVRKVLIMVIFLLVVTTTTVITFWLPKTYISEAQMSVDKDLADVPVMMGRSQSMGIDMFFIQTQLERVQSSEVLDKVIEDKDLNLNERWAKRFGMERTLETRESFAILMKRLRARNVRNTSIIEVSVVSEDKQEAADIANKIMTVYRDLRQQRIMSSALDNIKKYQDQRDALDEKIKKCQDEVTRLQTELKISDTTGDALGTQLVETENLRKIDSERVAASSRYVEAQAKYDKLVKIPAEQLPLNILYMNTYDDQLSALLRNQNDFQQQRDIKSKDFSPEHVEMVKLDSAIKLNKEQINLKVKAVMDGTLAQVEAAKAVLDKLNKDFEAASQRNQAFQKALQPYTKAKRDLENAQEIRRIFDVRTQQEEFEAKLTRPTMVEIFAYAKPALKPYRPNIPLNIALGVVVGLVIGIGLAFFVEYLDTSMKTIDDVEAVLQAPVIGVIPQNVGPIFEEGEDSPHAEAYRVLRTNVLFGRKDQRLNTVTVVSGGAGEGKSTTIMNMATIFAQNGQRVLLVDTDLRRPSLHKAFNVSNSIGLTSYLMGQRGLEEVIVKTQVKNLDFLPSGRLPASAMGILNSPQMKQFVEDIKQRYDIVFFDAPPILGVSDASILVSMMDMTMLVVQYRKYPQAMTVRAKLTIDKVGGNLLGIVLNNINLSSDSYYYYQSGYHYNHYARSEDSMEESELAAKGKAAAKPAADEGKVGVKQKY
jgi:succinoglycan biosynthesis transport protein ExoP